MKTRTKIIIGGIVVAAVVAGVYFWNKKPKTEEIADEGQPQPPQGQPSAPTKKRIVMNKSKLSDLRNRLTTEGRI